jgi:hypothetical protein
LRLISAVIDAFHVMRVSILPAETDAPLIVDPDAVLAIAPVFQRLKPVGWGNPEIIRGDGAIETYPPSARCGRVIALRGRLS